MTIVERLYLEVIRHRQRTGQNPAVLYLDPDDRGAPEFARTPLLTQDETGAWTVFMGIPLISTS